MPTDDRVIGCQTGETPTSFMLFAQALRHRLEMAAAEARIEELMDAMEEAAGMLELAMDGDSAPLDASVMLRAAVAKAMEAK